VKGQNLSRERTGEKYSLSRSCNMLMQKKEKPKELPGGKKDTHPPTTRCGQVPSKEKHLDAGLARDVGGTIRRRGKNRRKGVMERVLKEKLQEKRYS